MTLLQSHNNSQDSHLKSKAQSVNKESSNVSRSNTKIKVGIALLLGLFGIVIVCLIVIAQQEERNCDSLAKNSTANPLDLQICRQLLCPFDVSDCTFSCPFGYTTDRGSCPNSCICSTESSTYQGDIRVTEEILINMLDEYGFFYQEEDRFSLLQSSYLDVPIWNEHLVDERYKIAFLLAPETYDGRGGRAIEDGLEIISNETCIDFVARTTERHFLKFMDGGTCHSYIGRLDDVLKRGEGQDLSIDAIYCTAPLTVAHEVLHALGFHHEQSRADRDSFVQIKYDNVKKGKLNNFNKLEAGKVRDLGTGYDHGSILHFGGFDYAEDWTKPTIVRLDTGKPSILNDEGLTDLDFEDINTLYKCSPTSLIKPSSATNLPTLSTLTASIAISSTAPSSGGNNGTRPASSVTYGPWGQWTCGQCGQTRVGRRDRQCIGGTPAECLDYLTKMNVTSFQEMNCSDIPICSTTPARVTPSAAPLTFGPWTSWDCTQCAEFGYGERHRECIGGVLWECVKKFKQISLTERKLCVQLPCWHSNVWGLWGKWGPCSHTCGDGLQLRYRNCTGIEGSCQGKSQLVQSCIEDPCQPVVHWSSWEVQVSCSSTCGNGRSFSTRTCPGLDRDACPGIDLRIAFCNLGKCVESRNRARSRTDDERPFFIFGDAIDDVSSDDVICRNSSHGNWTFGDVNNDERTDAICRGEDGKLQLGLSGRDGAIPGVSWKGQLPNCGGGVRIAADFNGDGSDDLLCQNKETRLLSIYSSANGRFIAPATHEVELCTRANDVVIIADVNGDQKADFLCDHGGTDDMDVHVT